MQKINKNLLLYTTLWIFLLSATFVVSPRLWNPTETGKYFYLALAVCVAYPVACFRFLANRSAFRITLTDIALFCFVLWIFARNVLSGGLRSGMSLWFFTLLPPLYVIVRTGHGVASVAEHIRPILWIIVSATIIEAIWGFLQLYGLLQSYNSVFAISGSFFNPGPYSGFLACGVPLALYFTLKGRNRAEKILGIAGIVSSVVILPATMSRAAWIAVFAGCLYFVPKSKKLHWRFIVWGGLLVALFLAGVYLLKKESADGRVFVWRTSMSLVRENPLAGSGFGSFQPLYCGAQADYFLTAKATEEELMMANAPEYAFNEYLQITVEHGIIGLLLFLFAVYALFARKRNFQDAGAVETACEDNNGIKSAVQGSLTTFLVFAFFSYPFSVPALSLLFVVLAAISASLSSPVEWLSRRRIGFPVLVLCLGLTVYAGIRILSQYAAYREWKSAQTYYNTKDWKKAEAEYGRLYPELNQQKHFLFEYALCLSETGQYEASNGIFFRFLYFGSDPMVYNCMGNNYKNMGDYEKAENMYFLALHTVPNRHYPLYLLMKLYADSGSPEKAKKMAKILLEKPVKVESQAIEEMMEEAKKMLESNNN